MTHIFVGNLTIIGSGNGLSTGRRQNIIWTNAGILSFGPLGTNFSEILIEIRIFQWRKCLWKDRQQNGGHFLSASMIYKNGKWPRADYWSYYYGALFESQVNANSFGNRPPASFIDGIFNELHIFDVIWHGSLGWSPQRWLPCNLTRLISDIPLATLIIVLINIIFYLCVFKCLYILPLYILCIYSFMYWKSGTSDLLVLMLFVLQCKLTDYK